MSLKHLRKILATASCFAALVTLGHGETYTKIPPLPKITIAYFAMSNESFDFNTANAAGKKTFWSRQDDPCSTFLGKNDSIVRKRILNPRFKSVLLEKD